MATWLFPGRANQPLHPEHLAALVHQLGVPAVAGRGADALGYHHVTTTRLAAHAAAGATTPPAMTHSRLHRELATVE